jgi:predicted dienelactone hydrolase
MAVTCRWPDGTAPKGFVVSCHGLGANGREYEELSNVWAAHGYLVVHPTFPDWIAAVAANEPELGLDPNADLSGWAALPDIRARMHEILHGPYYWMERIRMVRQVLDGLATIVACTGARTAWPIPGAIAGHSFGAFTSQLFAGAEIDIPGRGVGQFRDNRLAAAVLLSAQGPDQQGLREGSWDKITSPLLVVTGTLDRGAKGQDWEWKSVPYKLAPPGGKYLAVLDGADHFLGGLTLSDLGAANRHQRHAVNDLTLAFLDSYVMKDEAAKSWLASISDHVGSCAVLFRRK